MKIAGTNYSVLSLKASTSLLRTQKAIARSLERLASGQRVSSPRDDAHAYVQGVGLTAQIRGLTQANFGLNTGLGMIATAESAVSTQINIVQRMRELAVQAANGSLTNLQRSMLNEEVQTLLEEYNRITAQTDFNGRKLLDGSFTTINLQAGSNKGNSIGFTIGSTQASSVFVQRTTVGDGTFQSRSTIASDSGARFITEDLNGDGIADIIASDSANSTLDIHLGNGNGTFQNRVTLSSGLFPRTLKAADFNADNIIDLVNLDSDGTASIHLGNGDGTFQTRTTIAIGMNPADFDIADFNGDGREDIMIRDATIGDNLLALGNGNGTFQAVTTISSSSGGGSAFAADINNDGKTDFISLLGNDSWIEFLLGNGNGTFQAATTISSGAVTHFVQMGDFNNDGNIDLIDGSEFEETGIHLGNGNGTFQSRTPIDSTLLPYAGAAGDLNGDGNLDFIVAENTDTELRVLMGNGNGTFQAPSFVSISGNPSNAHIADLNDDGVLDIMGSGNGEDAISIFLANTTEASSVAAISIATQEDAEAMLQVFDDAMAALSATQASLGAIHSRLNVAVASNLILSDNLVEARSKALDTDYASEVAELVRNQILQDASTAVLAQANLSHRLILQLLDFKSSS